MFIRSLALSLAALPFLVQGVEPITRIACGSCYKPESDKGIFKIIAGEKPDVFLFMGDCIYGDTEDMDVLRKKFNKLLTQPDYAAFSKTTPVLATWDDHDYGKNDAGREYPKRVESQKVFQDAFGVPANDPSRHREGVYQSKMMGPEGKRVQIILLDTRYFRSDIPQAKNDQNQNDYVPQTGPEATMLGEAQWKWLEQELQKVADLRIIVSSVQVLATGHRFEKWANMPDERKKFLDLLRSSKCGPTILLSGDRHLGEVYKLTHHITGLPFELFEMTTSGLTHAGGPEAPSIVRVPGTYTRAINYGLIDINWTNEKPIVSLTIKDFQGKTESLTFSDFNRKLTFK